MRKNFSTIRQWLADNRDARPALAQVGLPFALIVYLAFRDGGYEQVVWNGAGVGLWWLLVLGAAIGLRPPDRPAVGALIAIGLFTAFAVWLSLAVIWTDSDHRTVTEAARAVTYLGVFVLALLSGVAGSVRRVATGIGAAVVLVALLAALSRFEPGLLPVSDVPKFIPEATARLNFPLNYWNGLAALMAIGAPLVLHMAASSRRPLLSAAWTAGIPLIGIVIFMTLSRGGAIEVTLALAAYVALRPRRLEVVAPALIGTFATGVLILLIDARSDLVDGLNTQQARNQGDEMAAITLIVLVMAAVAAYAYAARRQRRNWSLPVIGPTNARRLAAAGVSLTVAAVIAAFATGTVSDRWDAFRSNEIENTADRLSSASGNGRYQYWESSVDAFSNHPLTGIGPGTWELWWAENGDIAGFVRDAHSLYFEVLAEAGLVGLLLIAGFIGLVIATGVGRTLRGPLDNRADLAAVLGGVVAFAFAAGIDWAWEQPVLPIAFMLLSATIMYSGHGGVSSRPVVVSHRARLGLGVAAALVTACLALPYLGSERLAESQSQAAEDNLAAAFEAARDARSIQPYSAAATLQEALVLEQAGHLDTAASAAARATQQEPKNWRSWFVLARIQDEAGEADQATLSFERARSLNPRSPLLNDDL